MAHGINMSALWISARTALLLVLFAVLAAGAFVRGRFGLAAVLSLAAMFSKEEGIVIPIVRLASHAVLNRTSSARIPVALFALAAGAGQVLYLVLRAKSGAITFGNAPEVYAPSFAFSRLMENLPEYLDRTSTFTAVIVLLAVAMCRPTVNAFRKSDRPIIVFGLLWWIGGLALTMFLPVRSSLYACLPSVGSVLIGTVVISGVWSSVPRSRQRNAVLAGLALPFLLWPVYRERNSRWVREADLSSQTIAVLRSVASERGAGTTVLLEDDRSARPSLDNSFGAAFPRAVDLLVSPPIVAWIEPPTTTDIQPPSHFDVRFALRAGRLVRVE